MNEWIVSASGIRGIVGECFLPHDIARMAAAFGTFVQNSHRHQREDIRVAIARDTRASGAMARHAVIAGLMSTGCHVVDLGICPTPTLLLMASELNVAGSMMITASHNPAEWNGMEMATTCGTFLTETERAEVLRIYETGEMQFQPWNTQGNLSKSDRAIPIHMERILASSYIDPEGIRQRRLRVVVDAVNGAGSTITPKLLRALGCDVVELHCEPNGAFRRPPEPTPKNLEALCDRVKQSRADLGMAHDADADRLTLVTEEGEAISEEYTFALIADLVLNKQAGPVVATVSTSLMIDDVAKKHNTPVSRTKVGVNHVVNEMLRLEAVLGGEGTGGVIFPEIHHTSDGITSAAVAVQLLIESGETLSSLVSQFPKYFIAKKSLPIPPSVEGDEIIRRAIAAFNHERLDLTDGVKILRDASWVTIRKSGTEPVIRVFGEARSSHRANRFCEEIAQQIQHWMAASNGGRL